MIERNLFYYRIVIIIFWIEACFGFVSEELLPFAHLENLRSPLFFVADIALVFVGIKTITLKRDLIILWSFVALAVLSTLIVNHESVMSMVNGSRQFIGMLFFVPIFRYLLTCERGAEFKQKIDRQLYIFLWIQALCLVEQFVRYGAGDHGGGSMGNGSSGTISTLICMISFYLISQKWDENNYFKSLKDNKQYVLLLLPVFLNETKISLIYIAVYFILLYRYEIKNIGKLVFLVPLFAVMMVGAYYLYVVATNQEDTNVLSSEYMTEYLVGEDTDEIITYSQMAANDEYEDDYIWFIDVPRFLKVSLMPETLSTTNGGMILGAGLGHFKGGSSVERTKFFAENMWVLNGSIFMLYIYVIQLGILGLIWGITSFIAILRGHGNAPLERKNKLFIIMIYVAAMFYLPMLTFLPLAVVFYYICAVSTTKVAEVAKQPELISI
jgi:hypothetical protein